MAREKLKYILTQIAGKFAYVHDMKPYGVEGVALPVLNLGCRLESIGQLHPLAALPGSKGPTVPINPLNPELNPICYLLALLGAHHFLHVSRIKIKLLTFRLLMLYIWSTHS